MKKLLFLFAVLLTSVGAWAQTVVGALGNPTTTLTDGNYVLMAMSDKGNGATGPCFYTTTPSNRKFQYDLNNPIGVGDAVLSKYVWYVDETTDENGVQHITITKHDDTNIFFPADDAKGGNFNGTTKASLKPELKTINGSEYFALTLDDANIGYIYANQASGVLPNLSYWSGYNDGGPCVKFTFHPVVELSELSRSFYTSQAPNDMTWRENTTWYFLQFPNSDLYHTGGYLAAEGSGFISSNNYSSNVSNGYLLITQTEKPIKKSALWCIVGDETNGYKFYNKMNPKLVLGTDGSNKTRLYLASETKSGVNYAYDYAASTNNKQGLEGCATFRLRGADAEGNYQSTNKYWNNQDAGGNSPDYLSVWDNTGALSDDGSAIRLTQVTEHELAEMAAKLPVASTAAEKKYYAIKNQRSADYATYIGDAAQIKHQARDTESAAQMWYFTADGNGYRVHNLATTKKYTNTSSFTADGAKVWVKENPYCAGFVCISTQENLGDNCWDSGNNNLIGTWNPRVTDYEGTSWMIEEVSPTATLDIAKLDAKLHVDDNAHRLGNGVGLAYYIINDERVYDAAVVKTAIDAAENIEAVTAIKESFVVYNGVKINNKDKFTNNGVYSFRTSKGWLGATESCANVISTAKTSHNATGDHNDPMFQWAVYQSANGDYYLYNLGKQMFMGVQSNNEQSIPFVEYPAGKKLTFKQSNSEDYPIMFSTDNAGVVNHNGNFGDGLITWTGGWNNLTDAGSNHQVTLVSELPEATLQEIAAKVAAYDRRLYVTAEVTGSWDNNPNTHFGDITATSSAGTLTTRLKTTPSVTTVDYDGLNETTIGFTRAYRGFEFQGFFLGEENLGKSFTLTEEQEANITEQNPLVAKFTATEAVTLFYDDDEFSYRIPAIERTSTDRLIAVSDYRHSLDDIGRYKHGTANPGIDLVIRTSDNNGKTWSETKTIAAGTGVRGAIDCAYGDAAIAVVGEKVLVMAAAGDVFFPNANASNNNRVVRIWNENNGDGDWSKEDISTELFLGEKALLPNGYAAFFGSGRMPADETGRIYGAMLLKNAAAGNNIYVVYTDDFGDNWKILGGSQTQVARADEPKVEILPNGQILLSARRGGGRHFRVFTYGTGENDRINGVGTWSNTKNGCDNGDKNATNGEIYHLEALNANGQRVNILLQSQPKGGSTEFDRKDVTIWYKEITETNGSYTIDMVADNWREGLQVSYQKSAYSAMTLQEDGRMAFFFEEAPCYGDDDSKGYSMVYMPLTIEEITKSNYFSLDADLTTEHTINVVLTDAQGNEYRDQVTSALGGVATKLTTDYPFITLGNNAALESDGETFTYTNSVTLPFKVSNEETTVWHNIYWPSNQGSGYPVYLSSSADDDTYVSKVTETVVYGNSTFNTADYANKISWAVYQVGDGFTFKFKNKLTGKFIQAMSVVSQNEQNVKYVDEAEATAFELDHDKNGSSRNGDYALKASVNSTVGYLCSSSAGYGYATHHSSKGHPGAWVKFVEAPNFETLFAEVNAVLNMFGDGLGQYSNISEENLAAVTAAKNAMQAPGSVKLNTLNEYKNYTSKTEGGTLNTPQPGQFFRIRGISGNYIDASSIYNNTGQMSMKSAETCNYNGTIFYLDEEKHLLNYATGTYARQTREIGSVGDSDKGVWAFTESPRKGGKYALRNTVTSGQNGQYLHDSDGNRADRCGKNCGERHDFTLEEVESLPFTFKKAALGFATFNAPVAVQLPTGVLAYVADVDQNKTTLRMYRLVGNMIPANTPVMLYNEAAKAVDAEDETTIDLLIVDAYTGDEEVEIKSKNDFYGTVEAETYPANETVYSLQKKQDSEPDMVGFYQKASGTTLGGFKAWIKTATASARAFTIIFDGDDATGLKEALGLENENVEIYDLSGRRLDKPAKGVNVIGGKLVIK